MAQPHRPTLFVTVLLLISLAKGASAGPGTAVETAGDLLQLALPVTAYAATFLADDAVGRTQFYKSFSLNLAATYALKYSIDRQRPSGNGSPSFPSGHTSTAFQAASFLQRRYGWNYGLPAYLVASFVGWSRVDCGMHYPTDVLAGAAIGVASSYLFTTPYRGLSIQPVADGGFYGLQLQTTW